MQHHLRYRGADHQCTVCGQIFDVGEKVPDDCSGPSTAVPVTPVVTSGYMQAPTPASPIRSPHSAGTAPKIIAFAGHKGSGKDTAADVFVAHGYVKVRMADGLKAMLRALLEYRGVRPELIEKYIEGDWKESPCPAIGGQTMRHAMQTLGTEWGRRQMQPDFWADATRDRINSLVSQGHNVAVSDIRFPNEVNAIKFLGGMVYHVHRSGHTSEDTHASETQVNNLQVDEYLINGYTSAEAFQTHIRNFFKLSL